MEEDLTEEKIQEFLSQSPEWYYYGYTKPPLRVWLLTPVILEDASTSPPQPPSDLQPVDVKEESDDSVGP